MIKLYTQSKIDKLKSESARRAVENFQIEQRKFASIVDSQPKVVWNDLPTYFNFPWDSTVVSITRINYGTESEKTLVHLLVNGNINELVYGISREDHAYLVEKYTIPSQKPVEIKTTKKRK